MLDRNSVGSAALEPTYQTGFREKGVAFALLAGTRRRPNQRVGGKMLIFAALLVLLILWQIYHGEFYFGFNTYIYRKQDPWLFWLLIMGELVGIILNML